MADIVITSEAPSSSSQFSSPSPTICRVCQKQFSQYTCPRCNTRYCSLPCYKSHSLRCTESFTRDNVVEELKQMQADDESKRKMLDILKRVYAEEEEDDMDENDSLLSEEIIQKILSGSQICLDDLTVDEQKHFRRAIASGELSKLITPWEPWWLKPSAKNICLTRDGSQLVQPLGNKGELASLEGNEVNEIPLGPETSLPPVRNLSAAEPSPLLSVHLVDIIYSYCFTLRLYNGDWLSDCIGSAQVVLSISSVLGQGGQPETVLEALSYCLEQTCSPAFRHMGGSRFAFNLMDDVIDVLYLGGAAVVCLLCDLQRMIKAAEKELKSEKLVQSKRVEMKMKLNLAERKVHFFMCWVNEQPREVLSSLAAIVKAEKSSAVEYVSSERVTLRPEEKVKAEGKPIIREIEDHLLKLLSEIDLRFADASITYATWDHPAKLHDFIIDQAKAYVATEQKNLLVKLQKGDSKLLWKMAGSSVKIAGHKLQNRVSTFLSRFNSFIVVVKAKGECSSFYRTF